VGVWFGRIYVGVREGSKCKRGGRVKWLLD
jgi:hypothetical protein